MPPDPSFGGARPWRRRPPMAEARVVDSRSVPRGEGGRGGLGVPMCCPACGGVVGSGPVAGEATGGELAAVPALVPWPWSGERGKKERDPL